MVRQTPEELSGPSSVIEQNSSRLKCKKEMRFSAGRNAHPGAMKFSGDFHAETMREFAHRLGRYPQLDGLPPLETEIFRDLMRNT